MPASTPPAPPTAPAPATSVVRSTLRAVRVAFFGPRVEDYVDQADVEGRCSPDQRRRELSLLLDWIARHGGDPPPAPHQLLLSDDKDVRREAKAALAAALLGDAAPQKLDQRTALELAVRDLERRTAPVSGRTLRAVEDPAYHGFHARRDLSAALRLGAIAMVGTAILLQSLGIAGDVLQPATQAAPDAPVELHFGSVFTRAVALVCWGMVGASFFLLRRLYQFTESRTFDTEMISEYSGRMVMGGIAGLILPLVTYEVLTDIPILAPETAAQQGVLTIGATGLAVLAGYAVRLVYKLFEKIVDELVRRFSLDVKRNGNGRRNRRSTDRPTGA